MPIHMLPAKRPARRPAPPVEKLLYSRKDAAFALSLSLRTIDTHIANQVLTTRRHGGRVLIPAADITRMAARILRCDMLEGSATQKRA